MTTTSQERNMSTFRFLLQSVAITCCCMGLIPNASAQICQLTIDGEPSVSRPGPNQVSGTATVFPVSITGTWTLTLRAVLRFTPTGGSEQTVENQPTTFTWTSSTPTGIGSSRTVSASESLEPHGNGSYRTREEVVGTCGGQLPMNPGDKLSSSISISRPARPDYTTSNRFLTYMNGQSGSYTTDIGTTFSNSVSLKAGATNGATGSPTWVLLQSSSGYAALSCTTCSQPTLTANAESDGCLVFNVQVKTSYGGFRSEPLFVAIERPKKAIKPTGNPAFVDRHDPVSGGGYLSTIFYLTEGLCTSQGFLRGYKLNEIFSNIDNNVDAGTTNWPIQADGLTLSPTSNAWSDTISAIPGSFCGSSGTELCVPTPTSPPPLSSTVVQTADQKWRVGSTTPGQGIVIQKNVFRRLINHGDHTSVVTPSN